MSSNYPVLKICKSCGMRCSVDHARAICPRCDCHALRKLTASEVVAYDEDRAIDYAQSMLDALDEKDATR